MKFHTFLSIKKTLHACFVVTLKDIRYTFILSPHDLDAHSLWGLSYIIVVVVNERILIWKLGQ